jgi:hypothetical protein
MYNIESNTNPTVLEYSYFKFSLCIVNVSQIYRHVLVIRHGVWF